MDSEPAIIERKHLLNKLQEAVRKKITTIIAPAGYGKTTCIYQLTNYSKFQLIYIRIPEISNFTVGSFLKCILNNIEKYLNSKSEVQIKALKFLNDSQITNSNESEIISDTLALLRVELNSLLKKKLIIAFDDLQYIRNADRVTSIFHLFVEQSFPEVNFVFASRSELPFSLIKQKSKCMVCSINESDLRFSKAEVKELACRVYSIKMKSNELDYLENNFKGWITGLHLHFQIYQQNNFEDRAPQIKNIIYEYFTEEVFKSLDEKTKSFLLHTAWFTEFKPEETNELLGITNSHKITADLINKNIFIEKISLDENAKGYKYKDLFEDFLKQKFNTELNKTARKKLWLKTGDYYYSKNRFQEAIKFFLKAESFSKAIRAIKKSYQNFIDNYNFNTIKYWLDSFPNELINKTPVLLFLNGITQNKLYNDSKLAKKELSKAASISENQNREIYFIANLEIINILISESLAKEALALIDSLLLERSNHEIKSRLYLHKGIIKHQVLELEESRCALEMSMKYGYRNTSTSHYNLAQFYYARSYFMQAEPEKCRKVLDQIDINTVSPSIKIMHLILRHELVYLHYLGCQEIENYDRQIEIFQKEYPVESFRKKVLWSDATQFFYGDFYKSLKAFTQLHSKSSNPNDELMLYAHAAYYNCYLGNYEETKHYLEKAGQLKIPDNIYASLICRSAKNLHNFYESCSEKSITDCKDVLKFMQNTNMDAGIVLFGFDLLWMYLKIGKTDQAQKTLYRLFNLIDSKGYILLIMLNLVYRREIIDFVIENIETESLHRIISAYENVLKLQGCSFVSEQYKQRIIETIPVLFDIQLRTFGKFELKIRGKIIRDNQWYYKKWKYLLTYFLINSKKQVTKEQIIELMSESKSERVRDNKFHQLLSNFRKILKPKIDFDDSRFPDQHKVIPRYLLYKDETLNLREGYLYKIDSHDFEEHYWNGMQKSLKEKIRYEELAKGIELYKGTFLPNCYADWCEDLRERFSLMYEEMLNEIIALAQKPEYIEEFFKYCEVKLKLDGSDVDTYLLAIITAKKFGLAKKETLFEKRLNLLLRKPAKLDIDMKTLESIKELFGEHSFI